MKTILFIIQKEFKQIMRNKGMLPIIFVLPLLQLIILSNAATFEVKNIQFSYIDNDHSSSSRALIDQFRASSYFTVLADFPSKKRADGEELEHNSDKLRNNCAHSGNHFRNTQGQHEGTEITFGHSDVETSVGSISEWGANVLFSRDKSCFAHLIGLW